MPKHEARPQRTPNRHRVKERTSRRCLCGKVWSPSRSQAKKLFKLIDRTAYNDEPVWFYECRFGAWHWTRMPPHRWPKEPPTT